MQMLAQKVFSHILTHTHTYTHARTHAHMQVLARKANLTDVNIAWQIMLDDGVHPNCRTYSALLTVYANFAVSEVCTCVCIFVHVCV